MSLAIIAPVYQNYTVLTDFLQSLETQINTNYHLFLVDVSKEKKEIPMTTVIYTRIEAVNQGYAAAVNVGVNAAVNKGFETFCIVNSDIVFAENFTLETLKSLEEHPHSIIGGKIYYASGYEYHKDRYTIDDRGKVIWYAGGDIDLNHATAHHRGVDEVDKGQYNTPEQTNFVTGCLLCYDKWVYEKVGEWNQKYFMYYEDADFCIRAKKQNIPLF